MNKLKLENINRNFSSDGSICMSSMSYIIFRQLKEKWMAR